MVDIEPIAPDSSRLQTKTIERRTIRAMATLTSMEAHVDIHILERIASSWRSVLPTGTYAEIFVDRMETELIQRPGERVVQFLRCGQCFGKDVHGRVIRGLLIDEPTCERV